MNKFYVTKEIAEKLVSKGIYLESDYVLERNIIARRYEDLHIPRIDEVLAWLREEKKLFVAINIGYCYESYEKPFPTNPKMEPILKGYYYGIWDLDNLNDKNAHSKYFESPEKAAIAGIEYCLDNLI